MKGLVSRFKKQSKLFKIEFTAALLLTAACIAAIPVMSWFSHSRELKTAAYINAPINLYITATHESDSSRINLGDINITAKNRDGEYTAYKNYVLCVRKINVDEYILQLACTTNIPFTYEIYRAEFLGRTSEPVSIDEFGIKSCTIQHEVNGVLQTDTYSEENNNIALYEGEYNGTSMVYAYRLYGSNLIEEKQINDDNRDGIADNTYTTESYHANSNIQINANPLYYQSDSIIRDPGNIVEEPMDGSTSDYYILKVKWDKEKIKSKDIDNNKETDIVYITAGNTTKNNFTSETTESE